jgi:outer membrane protein assembly factor BamB
MSAARVLLLAALLAGAARAQDATPAVLPGESQAAAARLDEARGKLKAGKAAEAADDLVALIQTAGDDLAPVGGRRLVRARWPAHALLARLPADELARYRDRVEPQARRWLEQGLAGRDERLLRKAVEEAFASRSAGKALDALGDLAFERGCFAEAVSWWRLLAPLRPPKEPTDDDLVFPDPEGGPARARAKQLLARLFAGGDAAWADDLQAFRADHGDAAGPLAGKTGRYADTLAALAREAPPAPTPWAAFGGGATHGLVVAAPERFLDRLGGLCQGPPVRFDLQQRQAADGPAPPRNDWRAAEKAGRSFAFHPLILGGTALVADARHVTAYDLKTGTSSVWFDAARHNGGIKPDLKLPAKPGLRYTLTVSDGRLYARLGAQEIKPPPARPGRDDHAESLLACLSLDAGPGREHFLWQVRPGIGRENAVFEGAPVARDGLVWIAATRFALGKATTAIHCYADCLAETAPFTPPLRWKRDVCEAAEPAEGRTRHHLLTLAGPNVVYCSHSGAVVALDALSGARSWAVRYPPARARPDGEAAPPRDLAPCVFAAGRLYVAPNDGDQLLCLDAATGRELWRREQPDVLHLLGVGHGRLIFQTAGGLRAVRADDGGDEGGWLLPDVGGRLPSLGRGLLIGDLVLWPTVRGVYAVRQEDGRLAESPAVLRNLPPGNLVFADGCLASADDRFLTVFVPPALHLEQKKREAERRPDDAQAALGLGRALADAGRFREAAEQLDRAAAALPEAARRERHRALLREGGREALKTATGPTFSPDERLRAARLLAEAEGKEGAAELWRALREDATLRGRQVSDGGRPRRADEVAGAELARLRGVPDRPAPGRYEAPLLACPELPLRRAWQADLGRDGRLLDADKDVVLAGTPRGLTCFDAADGKERWRAALPFAPTWARRCGDVVLVGGPGGVGAVRCDGGAVAWAFTAPFDPHDGDLLSGFRLAGGRLFFLSGGRRLFALAPPDGRVLWDRWAPGGELGLPDAGLVETYSADESFILIQTAWRRWWLLDAATGAVRRSGAAWERPWPQPPAAVDEGRALVFCPDGKRVVCLDGESGTERWSYPLPGPGLVNVPPRLLCGGGSVVVAAFTELGWRLERLDAATGRPAWPRPALLGEGVDEPAGWAVDGEAAYLIRSQRLVALSLKDAAPRWELPLAGPDGGWEVRGVGPWLLVRPTAPAEGRFQFRFLHVALQWGGGPPPEAAPGQGCPLLCIDARTGRLQQRLNLDAGSARPWLDVRAADAFWPAFDRAVVRREAAIDVCRVPGGLAVGVGGRVWALRGGRDERR